MWISQIVLLPTKEYKGLMPCDGRALPALEYPELFNLISDQFGGYVGQNTHNEPPIYEFRLPTFASPLSGYTYYVCVKGVPPEM